MSEQKKDLGTLPNWNLNDLYPSPDSPEFKKDMAFCATAAQRFEKRYKGNLEGLSGKDFGAAIAEYENLSEVMCKMGVYAGLMRSTGLNDQKVMSFYQNVDEKTTDMSTKVQFFNLEINQLSDENLAEKMKAPEAAKYNPYVSEVRAYKKYDLSHDLEKMMTDKGMTGRSAWVRLYDETMANLRYEVDGKKYTDAELSSLMSSPDAATRKKAGEAMGKVSKENAPLLALITNTLAKDKQIDDEWRGFEKPYSARNLGNQVEDNVVDALVSSVKEAYPSLSHRYYGLKAKWMGVDKIEYWDRNAPLPDIPETTYTWEEAKETVLKAYKEFSPKSAEIAQKFFDNNWIDAGPKEGKESGAYAQPCVPSSHPYILLNFQGRPNDVMTLAHELGHGIHQYLAREQGHLQCNTPLTLAETASVFGEMVTFQSILKAETDPKKKFALLASKTSDMLNTACRQIAFHEYETQVHSERRKDGELSPERLSEIWTGVQKESLGPSVNVDEGAKNIWGQIPHLIHTPFYVYAYAFGDCLVNSLYSTYKEGKVENFEGKYLEMLSKGGTEKHKEMLAPFGLDASKPDFWKKGLSVIGGFVDQLEKLTDELGMDKTKGKAQAKAEPKKEAAKKVDVAKVVAAKAGKGK